MAAQHPDASDAGRHCIVCQALDFLPFICRACDSPFCRDHADRARVDGHACTGAAKTGAGPSVTEPRSASEGSFKDLLPDRSGPVRPGPTAADTVREQKKQAGLALLHKNFPSTSASASASPAVPASAAASSSVPAAKPASAAARKVALMKLKRSAKPGDTRRTDKQVPASARRYLVVQDASSGGTVDVWLPKDCLCGKALDLLADALQIRNSNNDAATPAAELLSLARKDETIHGSSPLNNSSPIGSVTEDADTIMLIKGAAHEQSASEKELDASAVRPEEPRIEALKELSDADADYIASWMAPAFYRRDCGPIFYTGRTYEEDPEAHRLLFRAVVDRGSVCGTVLTTEDRSAFRVQLAPGEANRILDLSFRSGKDAAWDQLAERLGGYDAWEAQLKPFKDLFAKAQDEHYGSEANQYYRSMLFGVKSDAQGKGIGKALHRYTVDEMRRTGARGFFFWSSTGNAPLYEKMGCKIVKTNVTTGDPVFEGYPVDSDTFVIMEAAS